MESQLLPPCHHHCTPRDSEYQCQTPSAASSDQLGFPQNWGPALYPKLSSGVTQTDATCTSFLAISVCSAEETGICVHVFCTSSVDNSDFSHLNIHTPCSTNARACRMDLESQEPLSLLYDL